MQQLAELDHLSMEHLTQRWQALIGGEAPRQNRRYLVKRLAYRIQELAYGGLSPETRSLLADTYQRHGTIIRSNAPSPTDAILPGTCLLREWRGIVYRVTVCAQGFEYAGRWYASLTAIAREITGTKCSGPAFFRLKGGQR
jgi:hypothetical protein